MDERFYKVLLDNLSDGVYCVDHDRTITYWNKGAERLTGYTPGEVLGEVCKDNILNHVDAEGRSLCQGRCPLARALLTGEPTEGDIFLQHKDGYRIPVLSRAAPLRDENGEIIGAMELFTDNSAKMAALQRVSELEEQTLLDPLTGLANRRFTETVLNDRFEEMRRYGWQFGLLLMEVDDFPGIGRRHDREVSDRALRTVTATLSKNLRSYDLAGRWDEAQFMAVVVNVNEEDLRAIAEKLRALVERSSLRLGSDVLELTISIGATLADGVDTMDDLLQRAEELLVRGRNAGGNCVTLK